MEKKDYSSFLSPGESPSLTERSARMHEFHFELIEAPSVEEICRKVVDRGRAYIGCSRLGLHFLDREDPDHFRGGYAVDRDGVLQDEQAKAIPRDWEIFGEAFFRSPGSYHLAPQEASEEGGSEAGFSRRAAVPLWNGREAIGVLWGSNRPREPELQDEERRLLQLLARMAGHLISARKKEEKLRRSVVDMEKMASYDGLTGLYNRTMGTRLLHQQVSRALRSRSGLVLCYIDLDGLKSVNDNMGHNKGDLYIKAVAEAIKGCVRQSDIPCRMGGDEFMIVLPDSSLNEGSIMLKRLQRIARGDSLLGELKAPPWYSCGLSTLEGSLPPDGVPDVEKIVRGLIHEADYQMYREKRLHRGNMPEE